MSRQRIERIAGGGTEGDGAPATRARLIEPFAVGFDAAENLYIAEMEGGDRVRKVDRRGRISTVAGTGTAGFSGDNGPANRAQVNGPHHLLVRPDGEILLADTFNNRVRRIDPKTGIISTLVGTGESGFSGDGGPATHARFGNIICLALSGRGDRLYLCDIGNRRIRAMDIRTGVVFTVAGNGQRGVPEDGQLTLRAPLVNPRAIALDVQDNLYILERSGNALRVVSRDGRIRTLLDGLNGPKHLCIDSRGSVLIADTENHRILRYDPETGQASTVVGSGKPAPPNAPPDADLKGTAQEINLSRPHGVYVRKDDTLLIADSDNGRILSLRF